MEGNKGFFVFWMVWAGRRRGRKMLQLSQARAQGGALYITEQLLGYSPASPGQVLPCYKGTFWGGRADAKQILALVALLCFFFPPQPALFFPFLVLFQPVKLEINLCL